MREFKIFLIGTALLFILSAIATLVRAGEAAASWEFPTLRADGSQLEQNEIGATSLVYSCDGAAQQEVIVPYPINTHTVTGVSGSCQFAAAIIDSIGVMSAYSDTAVKQISIPPTSPMVFKVDIPAGLQQLIQACIERPDCQVVN